MTIKVDRDTCYDLYSDFVHTWRDDPEIAKAPDPADLTDADLDAMIDDFNERTDHLNASDSWGEWEYVIGDFIADWIYFHSEED